MSTSGGALSWVGPSQERHWVGTWCAAPQETEAENDPPLPGLRNHALRQVVRATLGGGKLRLQLSNEFGDGPLSVLSVHCATSHDGSSIHRWSDVELTFQGCSSVTISTGSAVTSDPFDFALEPLSSLAITIAFGDIPAKITGHPGSRTTSYLIEHDLISSECLPSPVVTDHWYVISRLEVLSERSAAAVVILGDSITDGRGSTTNLNNRWTDVLAERMLKNRATARIAMLNQGIGGNRLVLPDGKGPSAIERFDRDVLGQAGARWVVVMEGVNDLGGDATPDQLIAAYRQLIAKAHAHGLLIYGACILPFGGSSYDTPSRRNGWREVNRWIRESGEFDGVVDLNSSIEDPTSANYMHPSLHDDDHLHPNVPGHALLGSAVSLGLFDPGLGERTPR